jgi:hypothetical protein
MLTMHRRKAAMLQLGREVKVAMVVVPAPARMVAPAMSTVPAELRPRLILVEMGQGAVRAIWETAPEMLGQTLETLVGTLLATLARRLGAMLVGLKGAMLVETMAEMLGVMMVGTMEVMTAAMSERCISGQS